MHNPNKELPEWNMAAAEMWGHFLSSPIGTAGLQRLAALRPALSSASLEASALAGAKANGYEACLGSLMGLTISDAAPQREQLSTNLPDLDNDKLWPEEGTAEKPQ
jgi:hypothetical protein